MRAVLALDQGSHATRACVFDETGALRATHTVPIATQRMTGTQVEHDASELLASVRDAADVAIGTARAELPHLELLAAGLAVQRSTIVCCRRSDGMPLGPALSWQDRRNAAWLQTLAAQSARVHDLTGLPLSPHYGASKLRWCLEHWATVQEAARRDDLLAAPLASFLQARLTGTAPLADPANAARTLLMDTRTLDWSDELLSLFGLQRAWLPTSSTTCAGFGTLRLAAGAVQLRALTGDQSAVPFADGTPDPGTVYINLGTGAFMQRPLITRPPSPAPLLGSVLARGVGAADATWYSLEGTVNGAGSAVSGFCSTERLAASDLWPALESLADDEALPVYINGIGGLGSPWWRAQQPSRFLGNGTPLQRFAALVESIAFMIVANMRLLAHYGGAPRRILLSGGLSRSGWLCRRLAALLELPVLVQEAEASVRGVAALAAPGLAAGWPVLPVHRWSAAPDAALARRMEHFFDALARDGQP